MTTVTTSSPETDHIAPMVTPLEKTELKKKMLDACIAKQQSLISDFSDPHSLTHGNKRIGE